ncbi:MAG: hypothetical protein K6F00_10725 [Lachnospiraceae bacterium]|nr:hypothetical protein [Lachnospiraceae bacterium]
MKKRLLITALFCIAFCLFACGSQTQNGSDDQKETVTEESNENTEEQSTADNTEEQSTTDNTEEQSTTDNTEEQSAADNKEEQTVSENETLTEEECLEAIKNYCFTKNPDLKDMVDSDEYNISWEVTTNENNEIVVLYRSYTGSETRYYIDPVSGETNITEMAPGITDEEQSVNEQLNIRDYIQ